MRMEMNLSNYPTLHLTQIKVLEQGFYCYTPFTVTVFVYWSLSMEI